MSPARAKAWLLLATGVGLLGVLGFLRRVPPAQEVLGGRTVPAGQAGKDVAPGVGSPEVPSPREVVPDRRRPVVDTLSELLSAYREGVGSPILREYSRFGREKMLRLGETRLLALARPEETERWASQVALDPKAGAEDRAYAMRILGFLWDSGRKEPEGILRTLAGEPAPIRERALQELSQFGAKEDLQGFFMERCLLGSRGAFEAVSRWGDPSVVSLMEDLRTREGVVQGEYRLMADGVLKRAAILRSATAVDQIASILEHPPEPAEAWTRWAIDVSRGRLDPPSFQLALRRRLDHASDAARQAEEFKRDLRSREPQSQPPVPLQDRYISTPNVTDLGDVSYDDLLLELHRSGGATTNRERLRLREFGYTVDPEEWAKSAIGD